VALNALLPQCVENLAGFWESGFWPNPRSQLPSSWGVFGLSDSSGKDSKEEFPDRVAYHFLKFSNCSSEYIASNCPNVPWNMASNHLVVAEQAERAIFYLFVSTHSELYNVFIGLERFSYPPELV
jgi:hypothetical protein